MKIHYFLAGIFIIVLSSCIGNTCKYKFPIDKTTIESCYIIENSRPFKLDQNDLQIIIAQIDKAKCAGLIKGIVTSSLLLVTDAKDTLEYRFLNNMFKDIFNGDKAFSINDSNTLKVIFAKIKKQNLTVHQKAITDLTIIFKDYKTNEDGIESDSNINRVNSSLQALDPFLLTENDVQLLINYYIYYDPTDFNVSEKIRPILMRSVIDLSEVCRKRKAEKQEWENDSEYFDATIDAISKLK